MKAQSTVLRLLLIAALMVLGLLGEALIGHLAGNDRGPSASTSAAVTTSVVCPERVDQPREPLTTGEPLPFDCGIAEASGEHNLP